MTLDTNQELRARTLRFSPVAPVGVELSPAEWLLQWRSQQSRPVAEHFVLAHANDGVIWGRLFDDGLRVAERHAGDPWPELRWSTLLDLRAFGPAGEVRLWRGREGSLRGYSIEDWELDESLVNYSHSIDREYLLLGKRTEALAPTGLFERRRGRGGEQHAAPSGFTKMSIRHLYQRDVNSGLLRESDQRWRGLIADSADGGAQ